MEFNKRQLEQKIKDTPPRPNIIYKIRENQKRIRSKARPKAIFQALTGTITMVLLLLVIGSAIATIKQVEVDQVVIQSVAIQITQPTPWSGSIPHKIGGSEQQNELVAYAYEISEQNREFVYLIEAESGYNTDPYRKSYVVGSNGHYDYGIMQINSGWHGQITSDPKFNDLYWQIDRGYELYKGGTRFYGLDQIARAKKNIEFIAV